MSTDRAAEILNHLSAMSRDIGIGAFVTPARTEMEDLDERVIAL